MTAPAATPGRGIGAAVAALSLAAFASGISQRSMDALLPRLADDFGTTLAAVAAVITAFTVGYAVLQPVFGPLGDRLGKYRVIGWSCAACTLATLLCALAPGLGSLLGARVLAGATAAGIIPLAMAWIGDVVPYERRQPVLARFLVGQILGVAGGQLLGGLSADYLGRRAPFVAAALLFALATVVLARLRGRLPPQALLRHASGVGAARGWRGVAREYREVLRLRWSRVVLGAVLVEGATVFGAFAFFPAHLHLTLGVPLATAGVLVMPFGLGGLVFAFGTRRLLGRLGEAGLVLAGGGLMLAAAVSVALAGSAPLAACAAFAMGLGFYMMHNTLQTQATQMAPQRRGAAVSAFALCYFLGQSLGVSLAGWAASRFGTALTIPAAALGIATVALVFAAQRRRQAVATPP